MQNKLGLLFLNKISFKILMISVYFIFIIIRAFTMSYQGYTEMNNLPNKLPNWIEKIYYSKVSNYAVRYTGLEVGYGYFAPNVRARFFLDIMVDSVVLKPKFNTFEGSLKYENQLSEIFSNFYSSDTSSQIIKLKQKVDNLKILNIVKYTLKSNSIKKVNTLDVYCYCIINNSLQDYRDKIRESKLLLKKINFK